MTDYKLPSYAFVPGRSPHPVRDPKGHSYGRPEHQPSSLEPRDWPQDPLWGFAVQLFDAGFYWEAHEAWEAFWLLAEDEDRALLAGLIGLAAAGVKLRQGRARIARGLLSKARDRFESLGGGTILGVDVVALSAWLDGEALNLSMENDALDQSARVVFSSALVMTGCGET